MVMVACNAAELASTGIREPVVKFSGILGTVVKHSHYQQSWKCTIA